MPTIMVWAIIGDGERLLLARPTGTPHWSLPGGRFTDEDGDVEDALSRELAEIGVLAEDIEFLDSVYERRGAEVLVHNVFAVAGFGAPESEDGGLEFQWATTDVLDQLMLVDWLAPALPALLAGEELPGEPPDLDALDATLRADWGEPPAGGAGGPGAVLILRGPAGAGKSTVARAWCARFPRAVHIDGDLLRQMIVSGYASPVPGEAEPEEARQQLDLLARNAASLAWNFAAAGFHVVIDEVAERREEIESYQEYLDGMDVAVVTLLPDAATVQARDQGRSPEERMGGRAEELRRIIAGETDMPGLRLDTSRLSVEETVDTILARMNEARLAPSWEAGP